MDLGSDDLYAQAGKGLRLVADKIAVKPKKKKDEVQEVEPELEPVVEKPVVRKVYKRNADNYCSRCGQPLKQDEE